jgi:hypothetical protein
MHDVVPMMLPQPGPLYALRLKYAALVGVVRRDFDIHRDSSSVYEFLVSSFDLTSMNSYLLPAYWAYGLEHPFFEPGQAHLIGLWENDGEIDYSQPFPADTLPPGFRHICGSEIDAERLAEFWWDAFDWVGKAD